MVVYRIKPHDSLLAHRSVRVYAYKDGRPCGEYDGYWDPRRGLVTLYPAKGSWIYGRLTKITIYDREVRRMN